MVRRMRDPKSVLITGGAGFLGINLVRHLLARGYHPISLDTATFDYPERGQVEVIQGDIRDPAALKRSMEKATHVVHAAAALALCTEAEIRSVDIDGARAVIEEAERQKIERFVYISSTAVYGVPDHHPLVEEDKLDGVGPYGRAKVDAELMVAAARARGKMALSIIRPKSFVGPERLGIFALLYDWAQSGRNFPLIGNGKNRYQLLDVEDLCDAIRLCLEKPRKDVNETFNIGASEYATMKEDYQAVLDEAGFHKRIIPFPAAPAIWGLRVLDRLKLSPIYPWVYETAAKDSFVSIERAQEKLGYSPKFSNKQALVRNYQWYVANLSRFQHTTGLTHRTPWKQGAIALVKLAF
jgi:nucleoside-diphosphate-sugar epimerase